MKSKLIYNASIFLFGVFIFFMSNCEVPDAPSSGKDYKFDSFGKPLVYQLNQPDVLLRLPSSLKEISGLGYSNSYGLWAVNDEQGNLYHLDAKTGEIVEKVDFGKRGDYEGVELVNNTAYMVKSNGTIEAYNFETKEKFTHKTILKTANDVEGLGFDGGSLLLACKGDSGLENNSQKAIYSFDIASKTLAEEVRLGLDIGSLQSIVHTSNNENFQKRIAKFAPSGIAVHPFDKYWYILSSVGKTMAVVDEKGIVQSVHFLDKKQFPQPEGICFDERANLYISSEGAGGKGRLMRFSVSKEKNK